MVTFVHNIKILTHLGTLTCWKQDEKDISVETRFRIPFQIVVHSLSWLNNLGI